MKEARLLRGTARPRLIEAARHRFVQDGTLATTLDDVRQDAGVSVGSLYHHFPRKADLAAAVYAEVMRDYQAGFVERLLAEATAEGGVRAGVRHHLSWVDRHRDDTVLLLGERHESEALDLANRETFAAVRSWWAPHEAYGVLRPFDPLITPALWLGPVQELVRGRFAAGRRGRTSASTVTTFADAAWASLRVGAAGEGEA